MVNFETFYCSDEFLLHTEVAVVPYIFFAITDIFERRIPFLCHQSKGSFLPEFKLLHWRRLNSCHVQSFKWHAVSPPFRFPRHDHSINSSPITSPLVFVFFIFTSLTFFNSLVNSSSIIFALVSLLNPFFLKRGFYSCQSQFSKSNS